MHALPATFPSLSPAGAATPKIPPPPPTSTEEADDPCGGRLASTPALLSDPQLLRPAPIIDPSMPSPLRPQGGRAHGISHGCTLYTASPCGSAQHAPMSEDVQADRASANRCCFSAQRWLATPPQSCAHGHRLRNGTAPSQQAHVAQMQSRILERLRPSS